MLNLWEDVDPYIGEVFPVLESKTVLDDIRTSVANPDKETYTSGWMNTILTDIFNYKEKYIVHPQDSTIRDAGLPDFVVKKGGDIVVIVESKARDNYSLTELYAQVIAYADRIGSDLDCFIICNKGTFLSFGYYSTDWHHDNKFYRKGVFFDGFLAIQVHSDGSIKPVPQTNDFSPDHRLYKLDHGPAQDSSITAILKYMRDQKGQIDLTDLDFGSRIRSEPDGVLVENRPKLGKVSYAEPLSGSSAEVLYDIAPFPERIN